MSDALPPGVLDGMAWSFAFRVWQKEPFHEVLADQYLAGLVGRAANRRAVVGFAMLQGWVRMDECLPKVMYTVGPKYHRDKRDRYEKAHGIGRHPREDWEDR